jgi:hypothetical protein
MPLAQQKERNKPAKWLDLHLLGTDLETRLAAALALSIFNSNFQHCASGFARESNFRYVTSSAQGQPPLPGRPIRSRTWPLFWPLR